MHDLTLRIDEETIRPMMREPFEPIQTSDGEITDFPHDVKRFSMYIHTGTHIDAPVHYDDDGLTIDEIDVGVFSGPATVVDLREWRGDKITADVLEQAGSGVEPGDRVVLATGDVDKQLREHPDDYAEKVYEEASVLSADAAEWLVDRDVSLVANDFVTEAVSLSPYEYVPDRPVHTTLCGAGVPIVEYLCNTTDIVDAGTVDMTCLPLPLAGFEAAPARVIADA